MKYLIIIISLLFSCFSQAEVKTEYTIIQYNFDAKNIESMVAKVKSEGPKIGGNSAWAAIKWDLVTEYSFSSNDSGCKIVIDEMELIANVTLPNWQDIEKKSTAIQNWWRKYLSFIEQHENLHFEGALTSAKDFEKQLYKMPIEQDCKEIKSNYLRLKRAFIKDVAIIDLDIDKKSSLIFNSNHKLFRPLKNHSPVVFESGGMASYIQM